jgi:hypothetical protein
MTRRWRFAWAWFIGAVLITLTFGCPPPKPTPPPGPTPGPTPTPTPAAAARPETPVFLSCMPRNDGTGRFMVDGVPFAMIGAIPCWPTDGTGEILRVEGREIPYLWTLFSKEWVGYLKTKGANAVHARLGPSVAADQCCGLQDIGGPYLELPLQKIAMRARLSKTPILRGIEGWNAKFWAVVHEVFTYAGEQRFVVQVGILDGWVVKHSVWGDAHMPWPAEDVHTALMLPLNPSVRSWVFKVVYETCNYGNVIYEIGNETSLGPGWAPEWERAMFALVREAEQQEGCRQVVHMTGSNSRDFDGPYDYFSSHDAVAPTEPINGRPALVNEYNPSLAPSQFKALHCKAKQAGQTFMYWRSDGTDARQDESLAMLGQCDAPASCSAPQPDRSKLAFVIDWKVSNVYDVTPVVTKDLPYCTAIGMGEYNGQPRASCPMRNECKGTEPENFDCENRLACEQFAMSVPGVCNATAPTFHSDGPVEPMDQWGFRVRAGGTYLEACNCDSSICTRKEL